MTLCIVIFEGVVVIIIENRCSGYEGLSISRSIETTFLYIANVLISLVVNNPLLYFSKFVFYDFSKWDFKTP